MHSKTEGEETFISLPPEVPPRYIVMNGQNRKDFAEKTKKSIDQIEKFQTHCYNQCVVKPRLYAFEPTTPLNLQTDLQKYVYSKILNLQDKYNAMYQKIHSNYLVIVSLISEYLKKQMQIGNFAEAALNIIAKDMRLEISNSTEMTSLQNKILSLDFYASKIAPYTKFPDINFEIVISNLKETAKHADLSLSYCIPTIFDDVLVMYIETHQKMNKFYHEFIQPMKEKKLVDLTHFDNLVKIFVDEIHITDKSCSIVLRNSLLRIIFDDLYTDLIDFNSDIDNDIIEKLSFAQKATSRELNISISLMTEQYIDIPFIELTQGKLKPALKHLEKIDFFTNPIDIVYSVHKCLSEIDLFVKNANLEQKYGPFTDMFEGQQTGSALSFDDCFSIFWPIFSVLPPAGIGMMVNMMNTKIKGLRLSSQLEFAKLILASALDYSRDIDLNQLKQEADMNKMNT